VGVADGVGEFVEVGEEERVAVDVMLWVAVRLGVPVLDGVGEAVKVGVLVEVGVGEAEAVAVDDGVPVGEEVLVEV
jgi:hypothetical protein